MLRLFFLLMMVTPALAQTYPQYDKNSNHTGNLVVEGNRLVQRDVNGNPHGYWIERNGFVEHRDNVGNLIGKTKSPAR